MYSGLTLVYVLLSYASNHYLFFPREMHGNGFANQRWIVQPTHEKENQNPDGRPFFPFFFFLIRESWKWSVTWQLVYVVHLCCPIDTNKPIFSTNFVWYSFVAAFESEGESTNHVSSKNVRFWRSWKTGNNHSCENNWRFGRQKETGHFYYQATFQSTI